MRTRLLLLAVLALAPLDRALADPRLKITPLGPDSYRANVQGRGVVLDEALYAVEKKATLLCNRKKVEFGGYRYGQDSALNTSTSSQGVLVFNQDFHCVGPEAAASTAKVTAPHDDKAVLAMTDRFFTARDGGDFKTALSLFDFDTRRMAEGWPSDAERFNREAGASLGRRVAGIIWYDNPPSISRPGVYAQVDYVGGYANVPEDCGYLLWRTLDGRAFELVHEEHNFIPAGTVASLPPEGVAALRKKIGCAGPAMASN